MSFPSTKQGWIAILALSAIGLHLLLRFGLAVGGNAVKPVHQDSNIELAHNLFSLTGDGVKMGQLEPGQPYAVHGAFDRWESFDPAQLRLTYVGGGPAAGAADEHATRVASIMVGYDSLALRTVLGFVLVFAGTMVARLGSGETPELAAEPAPPAP